MYIDRHTATVISNFDRVVLKQLYIDPLTVPRKRFVNTVINHLVSKVIRTTCVRIHTWPAPHWLQTAQYFDIRRAVALAHSFTFLNYAQ
jgi:hypothetical protein